jgi:hypothetical protein
MRSLNKNKRLIHYAPFLGTQSIKDEHGNDTLEVEKLYGDKKELYVNYSSNTGLDDTQVFGSFTSYSRVISYVGKQCPLKEHDVIWVGITDKPNYEVRRVADSLNSYLIAIGEIA